MDEKAFLEAVNRVQEASSMYFEGLITAKEWAGRVLEASTECWDKLPD